MLTWIKDYEIGVEKIDAEHKEIIDQFEQLYENMRSGKGHDLYGDILDFLDRYIEKHFQSEEAFQEEIKYPFIKGHKILHEGFRQQVLAVKERNHGIEVSNKELLEINLMIKNWLLQHILNEDKKIATFINSLK